VPLILLAIPSIILGAMSYNPMLFADSTILDKAIMVLPQHDVLSHFEPEETHFLSMTLHAFVSPIFWLTVAGIVLSYVCYIMYPSLPERISRILSVPYHILMNKYGFDLFNEKVIIPILMAFGRLFFKVGDRVLIDGMVVNGAGRTVALFSRASKAVQSGYLYHYMAAMVFGLLALLVWLLVG